jgi:hypothetical protein
MAVQIQLRRDTAINWVGSSAVLAEGEIGIELNTMHYKMGDGVTNWNALAYANIAVSFPSSGSIGDSLFKNSTTDYDAKWVNHSTQVLFTFGSTNKHNATLTVPCTWAYQGMIITPKISNIPTTDNAAQNGMVEGLTFHPTSNVITNTSYEIEGFSPLMSAGQYYVNINIG